jgi:hypothetical protein
MGTARGGAPPVSWGVVCRLVLHPDHIATSVPPEDLDPVATSVAKEKEMTRERVLAHDGRGEGSQPVPLASGTLKILRAYWVTYRGGLGARGISREVPGS